MTNTCKDFWNGSWNDCTFRSTERWLERITRKASAGAAFRQKIIGTMAGTFRLSVPGLFISRNGGTTGTKNRLQEIEP